jgi:hypothetical protein
MGIKWCTYYFLFTSLQMGLTSAPRIYTRFGDAIEYIIVNNNKQLCFAPYNNLLIQLLRHYMDDYFGAGKTYEHALQLYHQVIDWFNWLGVPTKPEKCTPPAQSQRILGHIYDTRSQTLKMAEQKRFKAIDHLLYMCF